MQPESSAAFSHLSNTSQDLPHNPPLLNRKNTVSASAETPPPITHSGKPRAIRSGRPPQEKPCPPVNALRLRPCGPVKGRNPNSPKGQKNESRRRKTNYKQGVGGTGRIARNWAQRSVDDLSQNNGAVLEVFAQQSLFDCKVAPGRAPRGWVSDL